MKAAAVVCGVAVLFLGAVLLGLGQRQGSGDRRPPVPIQLREEAQPITGPTPSPSSTMRTVERDVDQRGLDDFDDHGGRRDGDDSGRGRGRGGDDGGADRSGPGGGDGGSGDDNSGG